MQGQSCRAREERFHHRSAELLAAAHVARAADEVVAVAHELDHPVDGDEVVGHVGHDDEHRVALGGGEAGLDRIQDAAGGIFHQSQIGAVGEALANDRQRIVLVEIVDDDDLVRGVDLRVDLGDEPSEVVAFIEDWHHQRQELELIHQRLPIWSCSLSHGMTSSSI